MKSSKWVSLGFLLLFLVALLHSSAPLWAQSPPSKSKPGSVNGAEDKSEDMVLLSRARLAVADQRLSDAEQYLLKAVSINPKNADALFYLGHVQGRMGKYLPSITQEMKCLELAPNYAGAYTVMGSSLAAGGDLKRADAALEKAIALDPQNATSYVNRAAVRGMQGDFKGACNLYNQAIKMSPNYVQAYLGLSTALGKMGDKAGQLQAAKDAVKVAPNSAYAHGRLGFLLSQNGDSAGAISEGLRANGLRIQDSWNEFLGMFLTAWASVFLAFACIFGVIFAGSSFKPQEGEKIIRSFFLTFYKDRPGRFVITDTRLVFVPESFSAWFGATRVSIQRPQIESINYLSTIGGGTVSILTRDQSVHQFRMPLLVLDPLRSLLVSQGLTSKDPADAFSAKAEVKDAAVDQEKSDDIKSDENKTEAAADSTPEAKPEAKPDATSESTKETEA